MKYNFKQFTQLHEAILGNYEYSIPDDPQKLFYDFYMSTVLTPFKNDVRDSEIINFEIERLKKKLYTHMREEFLDIVLYACSSEIKHATHPNQYRHSNLSLFNYIKEQKKVSFTDEEQEVYWDIFPEREIAAIDIHPDTKKSWEMPEVYKKIYTDTAKKYQVQPEDRNDIFIFIKSKDEAYEKTAMSLFQKIFSLEDVWEEDYGGEKWARIARAWPNLYNANSLSNMMVWIDHVYDLEHNTGSVFTKIPLYRDEDWLDSALEYKKVLKEPSLLLFRVSQSMKRLAAIVLKKSGGKSEEEFVLDRMIENSKASTLIDYVKTHPNIEKKYIDMIVDRLVNTLSDSSDLIKAIPVWKKAGVKNLSVLDVFNRLSRFDKIYALSKFKKITSAQEFNKLKDSFLTSALFDLKHGDDIHNHISSLVSFGGVYAYGEHKSSAIRYISFGSSIVMVIDAILSLSDENYDPMLMQSLFKKIEEEISKRSEWSSYALNTLVSLGKHIKADRYNKELAKYIVKIGNSHTINSARTDWPKNRAKDIHFYLKQKDNNAGQ